VASRDGYTIVEYTIGRENTVAPNVALAKERFKRRRRIVEDYYKRMGAIEKKFEKIDQVLFGVMIAVVLSMIAIIISVIGLFLDQMRVNNVIYKEYSQKTESVETTQKINETLFKQIQDLAEQNKQDREIIKQLLNKK